MTPTRSTLASGLRVVTESVPGLRSVTIGAWVGSGARDEPPAHAGVSHFLEHLLFKGTDVRGPREIAETVEAVGGEMNAFTTHEQTVFHVRVPDAHVPLAVEILADVVLHAALRGDDIESERTVILEEIAMRDDSPEEVVHDLFAQAMFPDHPLGREVLGTAQSIGAMPREVIVDHHSAHYVPSNMVIAAAGNVEHEVIVPLLEAAFDAAPGRRPARPAEPPGGPQPVLVQSRGAEQAHLVLGTRALPARDPDRYALAVLNEALGGGMASRLFQEVRETRGLVYSVYSYTAAFDDVGYLAIYAGTAPERLRETLDVIEAELAQLAREGLAAAELERAKGHLTGSLAMSLETSASRMRRIGRAEMVEREVPTLDELAARIAAVGADDVGRVLERVLCDSARTLAVVGPDSAAAVVTT